MAPEFSHNKGNHIRFMMLLFQLRFINCAMDFLFILHGCLSCSFFIFQLHAKISKEGVNQGVVLSAYYVKKTAACEHVR